MSLIKLVHIVFKTHLDIGFTNLAETVTRNYITEFIPKAMQTAKELRERGGPERFVWTTGSWLIHTFLKHADEESRKALREAIRQGDLVWHALPFTTHTELMNAGLFDYGLSLAAGLDRQFGKTTIAAKMSDVPGHTIGIVPLMAKRGIKYLHIGVNPGSCVPEVPRLFKWRAADGSEIFVQYDGDYGETLEIPGLDEALVIVHAGDNKGAPDADSVMRTYADISQKYPGAKVCASTLDAFARVLLRVRGIPVVTEEIGDTWIHGIATDPMKVAKFRELLRLSAEWKEHDSLCNFYDELIMVCEHTWGMNFYTWLSDYANWSIDDFHKARKADKVDKSGQQSYSLFESSHCEQRAYIDTAIKRLPENLQKEVNAAFENLKPRRETAGNVSMFPGEQFSLGAWRAIIGDSGELISLQTAEGRELAGEGGIGHYSYQTFSYEDYIQYHHDYNRNMDIHSSWIIPDFGKPGMQYAKPYPKHAYYGVHIRSIHISHYNGYDEAEVLLSASPDSPSGAPQTVIIRYRAMKNSERLELSLDWFDKEACRLPQAIWLSININAATPARWRFSKLGTLINPLDVVKGGNRSYHGIEFAEYQGCDGYYRITLLDSPLIALGARKMLRFDNRFEDPSGGIHVNIYNNIWGTNFPLWYEEDGRSRIIIKYG